MFIYRLVHEKVEEEVQVFDGARAEAGLVCVGARNVLEFDRRVYVLVAPWDICTYLQADVIRVFADVCFVLLLILECIHCDSHIAVRNFSSAFSE